MDARAQVIIWDSGERLSIRESVQRLSQEFPECPFEMLETQFVFWLLGFGSVGRERAVIAASQVLDPCASASTAIIVRPSRKRSTIAEPIGSFDSAGGEPSRHGADEIRCLAMEQQVVMARVSPS